jgi:hypothetical protein
LLAWTYSIIPKKHLTRRQIRGRNPSCRNLSDADGPLDSGCLDAIAGKILTMNLHRLAHGECPPVRARSDAFAEER